MTFEEKLNQLTHQEIWQEYCGFLDLSIQDYMKVQNRLLAEQIHLLGQCELGKRFFGENPPKTVDEFRKMVPLTRFEDYADILLARQEDKLPEKPAVWLKTTWEGGATPAKWAPYTDSMLDTYKNNILAALILSTSNAKGQFNIKKNAKVLYGLAPLPYATGLFPRLMNSEIDLRFMPSLKEAKKLSFSKQSSAGFKQALGYGIDLFFGMSSIIYGISKNFQIGSSGGSGKTLNTLLNMSPTMIVRLLCALYKSKRDQRVLKPKDLFKLNGFVCVGTDSDLFKDELEDLWGVRPLEIAGGTEPSCMGTETWSKDGLVFFPDACFYEFIPEQDMYRSLADPDYIPRTYLMNEVTANECYELVITVLRGGTFMRYRIGDVYRCLRTKNVNDGVDLPQFSYVDRIPTVIDIMGFTRITEKEINYVIGMSGIGVENWIATKEYDENHHSYLHLYLELQSAQLERSAVSLQLIREQLSATFKYYDSDYNDLKRLLGLDPLKVTLLPSKTIENYNKNNPDPIRRMNPHMRQVLDLMRSYQ